MTASTATLGQLIAATGFACALCACAKDANQVRAPKSLMTAALTPVAVTRLQESDSFYVGNPIDLAVSARNDYFIVDQASIRIVRFDSSGGFLGTLGRYGQGPNEFMMPTFVEAVDDTTVLISDVARRDFTLWNVDSASVRTRVQHHGEMGFFVAERGAITATVFNRLTGTIAAAWRLPATQPRHLGTLPQAFAPTNRFASIYGPIPFSLFGDSVAYLTGESNYLRIADSLWNATDSIVIPRERRRGVPAVIDTTMGEGQNIYDVMRRISIPYALHRLSGSRFAVVHLDYMVRNNAPVGAAFLTIVGRSGPTRCIDMPLPVHDVDKIPQVTFRGDTLFLLDQYLTGDRAVIDIQRFTLASDMC